MIITIFDHHVRGVEPLIEVVDYYKGKKLHFNEIYFPLSNSSIEHIYVGF
jgi:hypothetical protein